MPSSLAARDSPRAQHGRRRAPRGQLARSNSLFGTLKNIVTGSLAWLTSYEDQENVSGKRGRNVNAMPHEESTYLEDQPSAKRKRVDSPEPAPPPQQTSRTTHGYLDVPEKLLPVPRQRHTGHGRSSSLVTSLSIPGSQLARRTASPTGISSFGSPSTMLRTQSMDPPAYRATSLSRDVSMEDGMPGSVSRDVTMSPSRRTPFQLRPRSSLTPQPSGQSFGPTTHLNKRDASEPPPLATLMSNPVFVKPPPQMTQAQSERVLTTLGSLSEASGYTSRSPIRQHSILFIGANAGAVTGSGSTPFVTPINAAEKALHDLDVYKTPLLPSRLRDSQTIPDMFKPRKAHAPVLMRGDRDREGKPRLGTSEKKGNKKVEETGADAPKPYAGRGNMKKMLARRKLEEQEEIEKERASAIETDQDEVPVKENEMTAHSSKASEVSTPPLPVPTRAIGGREQSSLRVGRTLTSRTHYARRTFKSKNRFSAAFEDDEDEDAMIDESREQLNKLPTLFESPKGFSFAQDKATILQDSSNAKEPAISALPFSLTKPSRPATAAAPEQPPFAVLPNAPASAPAERLAPKSAEAGSAAASSTPSVPLFPAVPSISLVPPSPTPVKPAVEVPIAPSSALAVTTSAIPNFFANSSIFAKPGVTIAPPSVAAPRNGGEEINQDVKTATTQFSLGGPPSLAPQASISRESHSPTTEVKVSEVPVLTQQPVVTNPFTSISAQKQDSSASQTSDSSAVIPAPTNDTVQALEVPEVKLAPPPSTPFSFTAPSKPTEQSSPSSAIPFSFGSGTMTAAPVNTPAPFAFKQHKNESAKAPEPKPLFGAGAHEQANSATFVAPAPTPSPFGGTSGEAPKPAFNFGQPTQSPSTAAPTIEAPKPLFPSTSTGGTGGFSFSSSAPAAPAPATPAKPPFSFGTAPSNPPVSTPVESKAAFTFGAPSAPAVSAPTGLFGGPSNGSNGSDVSSKPFTFGASTPARPVTPPQKEQDMMDESPTRGGGMEMNGHQQPSSLKPSNVFTFGGSSTSTSSPFGQPSQPLASPFSFGGNSGTNQNEKAATSSFASFGQLTSAFPFGARPADGLQSPLSPAPFVASTPFGQTINTPTAIAPSFSFGASSSNTGGGFGQLSQPTSPSTFGQPTSMPFAFGGTTTSATAPANQFAFGSQPASPAPGNIGLPQPPGSSGGPSLMFGAPNAATTAAPSSPFGAPPSLPLAGGVSFTIGSAAPQPTPGGRPIKKLPTRRGRPR